MKDIPFLCRQGSQALSALLLLYAFPSVELFMAQVGSKRKEVRTKSKALHLATF